MPRIGLTPKQQKLLDFIEVFTAEHGHSPSYQEMGEAMGLHSRSGAHRLLDRLQERGHIYRRRGMARSLVLAHPTTADQLRDVVLHLAKQEGPERTAAALVDLCKEILPQPEGAI